MGSDGASIKEWINNTMLGISVLYAVIAIVSKIAANRIDRKEA